MQLQHLLHGTLGLGLAFGLTAGLTACGSRPAELFELDPLDAAPMQSCTAHGPLQRTCDECNGGDTRACLTLAADYERRFVLARRDSDQRIAMRFYGRACAQGDAAGCVLINDHYATIRGLEYFAREVARERRDRACTYVDEVCAAKSPLACRVEGLCLAEDWPLRKGPRDLVGGARAFTAACDLGDARGCLELGWLRAAGPESELPAAFAAHQKSCELGSFQGCVAAAAHTYYGLGTTPAPEQAMASVNRLCEQGSAEACQAARGYFASLRPLLVHEKIDESWTLPSKETYNALELRPAYVVAPGRVGFCVRADGGVDKVETLDSTGEPLVDQLLRESVSTWKFPRRPAVQSGAPLCSVHEQRLAFTFRSVGSRPLYTVWEQYMTTRGGLAILDTDPLRWR
jgi:hypothetical protein